MQAFVRDNGGGNVRAGIAAGFALGPGVAAAALAAPFAYVGNEGSGTISVIDTASDRVVDTLRFGRKPRLRALPSDGKRLFVSVYASRGA